jgi:hypothetical protein
VNGLPSVNPSTGTHPANRSADYSRFIAFGKLATSRRQIGDDSNCLRIFYAISQSIT